jgi:outer membrane lipoprotein SlyB
MHGGTPMTLRQFAVLAWFIALGPGCATTTTTSTTWTADPPGYYRQGEVTWVREYVQRHDGDPAGGAIAGAIIGGILGGGHGASALFGAAGGAAIGAAASQGHGETRYYDVGVQFEDGSRQVFRYPDLAPFSPGTRVVQTAQGLAASS